MFREHATGLVFFARKYTGDLDSAKEIVQAVFIRIWENRAEFDWDKPPKSYLFTAVYNRSMNHLRDVRRFVSQEDVHLSADKSGPAYLHEVETAELESRIQDAIRRLPEMCRKVFELSRFEGRKYPEIAELLQISVKTVESHMSKALALLREDLKEYLTLLLLLMLKNLRP
jgi:RNA polymerase sigma-70 factor, ECF subfamily